MLDLLELLRGGKVPFTQLGDNQSTITIIRTGVNSTMRHFGRQHGIDLGFLHGHCKSGLMDLGYCVTDRQCGDIFTKHCVDVGKWSRLLPQIGHYNLNQSPAPWTPKMKSKPPREELVNEAAISTFTGVDAKIANVVNCLDSAEANLRVHESGGSIEKSNTFERFQQSLAANLAQPRKNVRLEIS